MMVYLGIVGAIFVVSFREASPVTFVVVVDEGGVMVREALSRMYTPDDTAETRQKP